MNLESNICRLLLDIKELTQSSVTASLVAASSTGELKLSDEMFKAIIQVVEQELQKNVDAGISQVPLILKSH
jgi:hypothetical protein